jgi:hypothetical protein
LALTSLSNGIILPRKMRDLGISGKTACAIVGISPSRFNLCTAGQKDLSPEDAAKLHALLAKLAKIQASVPFPLNFGNAARWQAILEHLERANVDVNALADAVEKVFNNSSQQLNQ